MKVGEMSANKTWTGVRLDEAHVEKLRALAAKRTAQGPGRTTLSDLVRFAVDYMLEAERAGRINLVAKVKEEAAV